MNGKHWRYKYQRGEEYSVDVIVDNGNIITFINVKLPAGINEEVFNQFFEEAEVAVLKKLDSSELPNGAAI